MLIDRLSPIINLFIFLFFITVITIKNAYYIAPLILVLIAIVYLITHYKTIYIDKSVKYYIVAALAYYAVSLLVAIINHDSIPHSFKPDHFLLLSIPLLLLFIQYKPSLKGLSLTFATAAILSGLLAIYNKFFLGIERAFESIHPIPVAAVIMTLVLYCITLAFYFLRQGNIKIASFLLIAATIGLAGNILTGSRGTWLIFPVAIILLFWIYAKSLKRFIIPFSVSLISLIIIAGLIPQSGIQQRYHAAVSDITLYFNGTKKETSIGMRFELWRSALDGIKEKPLLGWGKDGMDEKRLQQSTEGKYPTIIKNFPHTHNLFIEQTFYRGFLGLFVLLLFLCIISYYFIITYRNSCNEKNKVIAFLGIINILSLFSFSLSDALLRGKEYAMFFYISNIIFYAMTLPNKNKED
ncbi:O-antigen ligase [Gallibacterium genomosp. 2]|uniref:O-antigen ligase n=1 Tax=Gallibacterium genomosp. 2 TaxID=155517 RepID=A0A0A2Y7A9_9PAST|nr:O-antigen ligase family protein [Gallibacterium genomosp. 2]KGQ33299.1 O-antigen ligase [Gallibacterium genomosp. 2]